MCRCFGLGDLVVVCRVLMQNGMSHEDITLKLHPGKGIYAAFSATEIRLLEIWKC